MRFIKAIPETMLSVNILMIALVLGTSACRPAGFKQKAARAVASSFPIVLDITSSTDDGYYSANSSIKIQVTFSEYILVDTSAGTPTLTLETGAVKRQAVYKSGSNSAVLEFEYTVVAGDSASDLNYEAVNSLALNGATIRNSRSKDAVLSLPDPRSGESLAAQKSLIVDTVSPDILNVTSSNSNGTYHAGDIITVSVTFSETVTVTGSPALTLETGTTDRAATYSAGSGSNVLSFLYTVQAGDASSDLDFVDTASLALGGATIADLAENESTLTLPAPASANSIAGQKTIVIDTIAPVVTDVSSTHANGVYGVGTVIDITVTFSEIVTVTGAPLFTLETGSTDQSIAYLSGSGTNELTFRYTVQAGDQSADLEALSTGAISFSTAAVTIQDLAHNDADTTLPALGGAHSLSGQKSIVIDGNAPYVTNVSSTTANGTFTVGDQISITVEFSETVQVSTSGGTPFITLETGANDRNATYVSGSGTSTLTFNYTVQSADASADLEALSRAALGAGGGTIQDAAGNTASLTLTALGGGTSLSGQKAIIIDTGAPSIIDITSTTANGAYTTGNTITITVQFSEPVAVVTTGGTPTLTLETGATDRNATYASGSASDTLTFTYTVQSGDSSADLEAVSTSALVLNGGAIRDGALNAAILTLPTLAGSHSISGQKAIIIDTGAPSVTQVSSAKTDGTYATGETIDIEVTFSEIVIATGTPTLTLETGTTDQVLNYLSGSGSNTLTFRYVVQSGDASADLQYVGTTSLALNGGIIRDAAANNATLSLPALASANSLAGNKAIVIDTTAPTIIDVTSTDANGTFKEGDVITVTVQFSESVTVSTSGGTPKLTLETGATDRTADYVSGSGTDTLTFTYMVQSGDVSADLNAESTSALALDGGTIKDSAGSNASLTLPALNGAYALATHKAIVIDTTAPTVTNVSATNADGNYTTGAVISVVVTFSENVSVVTTGGTPSLTLETGTTDRAATYTSGSGTSALTFQYTVVNGDASADLEALSTSALALNGGTVRDGSLHDATLTLPALAGASSLSGQKAIVIDTAVPTITNVSSTTANGSYKAGQTIDITVTFSEAVTVVTTGGTPTLTLETGSNDWEVAYASGSGNTTLTFQYTVQAGDTSADLEYYSTTALALNGGTIKDASGNNAALTLPALAGANSISGQKAIVIDTTAPTVTNVSSTKANGTYYTGEVIDITVTFSEAVDVLTTGGTPTITLETGGTDQAVNYSSGSGSTTLTFTYTVQNGDATSDLDYASTSALALNSGTIKDAAGNSATLTLPTLGGITSIAGQKAIVIVAPISMTVAARYSIAPNWMDHAKASDTTQACAGTETGVSDCIHGGEYKKVDIAEYADCSGLAMTDARGLFDWTCTDNGASITFYGILKSTKTIADTIDFNNDVTPVFYDNSVTLTGCGTSCPASSSSSKWWTNTLGVLPDNAGGSPIALDGSNDGGNDRVITSGTLLTLANSRNTAGFLLNLDKVGVVLATGATLTHTGTSNVSASACAYRATICVPSAKKYNYFEGQLNGSSSTGHYGYLALSSNFTQLGNVQATGYSTNGIHFNGATKVRGKSITATSTGTGAGILFTSASRMQFDSLTANSNGGGGVNYTSPSYVAVTTLTANSNTGPGFYVGGGSNNTITTLTANSNTTYGISVTSSAVAPTVSGSTTATSNGEIGLYAGSYSTTNFQDLDLSYNTNYGMYKGEAGSITARDITIYGDTGGTAQIKVAAFGSLTGGTFTFRDMIISQIGDNNGADIGFSGGYGMAANYRSITVTDSLLALGVYFSGNGGPSSTEGSITIKNAGSFKMQESNSHTIDNVTVVGGSVYILTSYNRIKKLVVTNSPTYCVAFQWSTGNRVQEAHLSNCNGQGLLLSESNTNMFGNLTINNVSYYAIQAGGSSGYNFFGPTTITNVDNSAIVLSYAYNQTFLSTAVVNVNGHGLYFGEGGQLTTLNNFASLNNTTGIYAYYSATPRMTGAMIVGSNSTADCTALDATALTNTTCTSSGTSGSTDFPASYSTAFLRRNSGTPLSAAASFVGKVSDDSSNTSDSSGTATYDTSLDFLNFENFFRSWGKSGSAFPNSDNRSYCSSGTCQIWDWSLRSSDTLLLNVSGNGSTINNGTDASTNGVPLEITGDSSGDDDGVCEAGELCKNSFTAGTACPVQVNGDQYIQSWPYTYLSASSNSLYANGYRVVEDNAAAGGDNDGVCEAYETCVDDSTVTCANNTVCVQRFLKNAVEIMGDGIGDDDTLCEKNEDCLYSPNIGAYQGHGTTLESCTYNDMGGPLTGIEIYAYPYNGR